MADRPTSSIEQAETLIKAVAFEIGIPEIARRADLNENTARKLLRAPPAAIDHLKRLEAVALQHKAEAAQT
jgi:hypothetical protein